MSRNSLRFFAAQCHLSEGSLLNNTYHTYPIIMADDEKRSAKRSRFDQTEPEPKRSSRFDRRSRSPSSRSADVRRSRSPLGQRTPFSPGSEGKSTPLDPAAAAGQCWNISSIMGRLLTYPVAAAAARINAQIQAKKGIQHVDVPPIRSVSKTLVPILDGR